MPNVDSKKNNNIKQGGYGKKYVNNMVRLNEGTNDSNPYEL
jgi:hypothetical protein